MPLDPRVARFLAMLAAGNPPDALQTTVAERRAALANLMSLGRPEVPIGRTEDRWLTGAPEPLPMRVYSPLAALAASAEAAGAAALPGLVYFHGGGLVAGSIDTHDAIARALSNAGACRVVSLGYRLGPEHRFPDAVDDALCAIRHVAARADDVGIDPERLGVCGDSAGGTLAAACCQLLAREGGPSLGLQLLLCPILDYSRSTESRRDLGSGYLVDQATLEHDLLHYLPADGDRADPRVSPLRAADLSGMPPTVIHTAEFDPLRDEGQQYAERLRDAGGSVRYRCHPGMIHLFYGLGKMIPYAHTAFEQIGADVRAAFGG